MTVHSHLFCFRLLVVQGGGGGSSSETLSRRNEGGDASFKHEDMWLECYPYESIHISRDQILPPLDMPIIKTQRRIKVSPTI